MPRAKPTPMTAPTRVCVVEMGIPSREAMRIVAAAPNSAEKPRVGVSSVIFFPMVSMTRHPHVARPMTMPMPPRANVQMGIAVCGNGAGRQDVNGGGKGADGVGDVVGAMSKGHKAGADDLQIAEDLFHQGIFGAFPAGSSFFFSDSESILISSRISFTWYWMTSREAACTCRRCLRAFSS